MTYTVTAGTNKVDWVAIGSPDEIIIPVGHTTPLHFIGIRGSRNNPVFIYGGSVTVPLTNSYGIKFDNCQNFKLRTSVKGGHIGISVEKKSTDFELDTCEVSGTGFCGVMAKDDTAPRGTFTMQNISIHDCFVHDCGLTKEGDGKYKGEGLYIGGTAATSHDLRNVKVFRNRILNTKWDGMQVGQGIEGVEIHHNRIENYGLAKEPVQSNGIQIGNRTGGECYENLIMNGSGNGIIVLGDATNIVYRNMIISAGENGIFCDDRESVGTGFKFMDNVIVSPKLDCLKIQANKGLLNEARDNVFIRPGSLVIPGRDNFVNKGSDVILKETNNLRSMDGSLAAFLIAKYSG